MAFDFPIGGTGVTTPSGNLQPIAIAADAGRAGFTGNDIAIAVAISLAENSASDPTATHKNADGSTDYGLWQINSSHANEFDMHDWANPQSNANMAYKVFKMQGWKAWSTYNDGAYLVHLPTGKTAASDATKSASMNPLNIVTNPLSALTGLAIFQSGLWKRIGIGVLGAAIVIVALVLMVSANKTVRGAATTAGKAALL